MKTIQLTQGKVALVDDADYEAVSAHKWHACKHGRRFYAARKIRRADGTRTVQYLHQFLIPGVAEVDHRDGDGLNNQRYNLRPSTHKQNMRGFQHKRIGTASKFRGVRRNNTRRKWRATIQFDGIKVNLGSFECEFDAARAYNEAALKYFGDRAHLNAA